jgi:hypothetical protein
MCLLVWGLLLLLLLGFSCAQTLEVPLELELIPWCEVLERVLMLLEQQGKVVLLLVLLLVLGMGLGVALMAFC